MRKNSIKYLIFFVVAVLISFDGVALESKKKTIVYDTAEVSITEFSEQTLEEYRSSSDFDYGSKPKETENYLRRLWLKIVAFIASLFTEGNGGQISKVLVYVLAGLIIAFCILKLLGVKASSIFYSGNNKSAMLSTVFDDNIHEINFETQINEAVAQKEYRKAIRLYYLFALKKLTDKNLVQWEAGKTNHEYNNELSSSELRSPFENLSLFFEYTWYGNFEIDKVLFEEYRTTFNSLSNQINKKL